MESYIEKLALTIKEYRLSQSKTQAEFAEILDVSLAYYQNIEQARRKPSLKFLYRLTGLGFSIDSAFGSQSECRENLVEEIGAILRQCSDSDLMQIKEIASTFIKKY